MQYMNPMLGTDFYKIGHVFQYPEGTTEIYSNFTPRSDRLYKVNEKFNPHGVINFGLQAYIMYALQMHFNSQFFNQPRDIVLNEYQRTVSKALGTEIDITHIADLYDLGYLPIEIKALPEGSLVPCKVPLFTVRNTQEKFFWLTNYIETWLSADIWAMTTNATIAFTYRCILEKFAVETGSPLDFVKWQGHDFSARGMSTLSSAVVISQGHLTSFLGTDTIGAINSIEAYYGGLDTFVGGSVPATEHSVMCAGGEEDEIETFRRILKTYPSGIVSIVSDTWDFWNVVGDDTSIAAQLKDEILNRKENELGIAKTVFRPDSGNPADILCGTIIPAKSIDEAIDILKYDTEWIEGEEYGPFSVTETFNIDGKYYEVTVEPEFNRHDKRFYYIDGWAEPTVKEITVTPEKKGAVQCLWDIFGGTINEQGYKVLNPRVGLIYGDSITTDRAIDILQRLKDKGFASCNVVFGIGSFTYQYNTRDTFGFAMKATHAKIEGQAKDLFKNPKTDNGVKKSAKGYLRVEKDEQGNYVLFDQQTEEQEAQGELETVFKDGKLVKFQNIVDIRARVDAEVQKMLSKM